MADLQNASGLPEWIFAKHPHYLEWAAEAVECLDFYKGGKHVTDKTNEYLLKHCSEKDATYQSRCQLKYYDNKIAELVDTLYYYIFQSKSDLKRTKGELLQGDNDIRYILKDIDGLGTYIDRFMLNLGIEAAVAGLSFIYIEPLRSINTQDGAPANITINDVLGYDLIPRFKKLSRSVVENWNVGLDGKVNFVKLRYKTPNPNMTFNSSESERYIDTVILWEKISDTACRWEKRNAVSGLILEERIVSIPEIPIVPCYGKKVAEWEGEPLITSAKDFAKTLYNLDSMRTNFLNFSATYQIVFPVQDSAQAKSVGNLVKGEEYYWVVPQNCIPSILQNPTAPYEILTRERTDVLIPGIYQNLKQRLQSAAAESVSASGESKKEDFRVTNAEISYLAKTLEEAENKAYKIQMSYIQSDPEIVRQTAIEAIYPSSFNVESINERFDEIVNGERASMPKSYLKMKRKAIIQSDRDYQALSDIEQEIIDLEADEDIEQPPTESSINSAFNYEDEIDTKQKQDAQQSQNINGSFDSKNNLK